MVTQPSGLIIAGTDVKPAAIVDVSPGYITTLSGSMYLVADGNTYVSIILTSLGSDSNFSIGSWVGSLVQAGS
jgi:hypothetical protein